MEVEYIRYSVTERDIDIAIDQVLRMLEFFGGQYDCSYRKEYSLLEELLKELQYKKQMKF